MTNRGGNSSGETFDIKPPKGFKKKTEADFVAEEESLREEVEKIIRKTTAVDKKLEEQIEAPLEEIDQIELSFDDEQTPEEEIIINEPLNKEEELVKQSKKKKFIVIRLVSIVFAALATIINGLFLFRLLSTSILPAKYAYPAMAIIIIITLFYIFKVIRLKTKKVTLIILDILAIVLSACFLFATLKINEIFGFLDNNFNNNKQFAVYNVVVNKESGYKELDDLRDKTIRTYEELIKDISDDKLKEAVSEKIPGSRLIFKDDIDEVMNSVLKDVTTAVLINEGTYGSYIDNNTTYDGKVKIIGTIEVEASDEVIVEKRVQKDLTNSPFIIFLSGIDTRTGKMPTRSLSDVNMLIAVNPVTKKIAMITTPRDYYVQLHGTTGLKDKLTHAGSKGGVKLSQATIEDLYDVKVDRYIRVNFKFVMKLVDAIGGIKVYQDVNYGMTTAAYKCKINPGWNDVDGTCALGFARERKSYKDGDRHRGRNQMHVIEQVLKKVTSASTILSKYSQIMKSLEGTFDSNISTEDITSLVRMQLDDMSGWDVEAYSVNGKGSMTATYSYPGQNLYVMIPDMSTVETAKKKIQSIMEGK